MKRHANIWRMRYKRKAGFAAPSGVSSSNFSILGVPASAPATVSGRVTCASGLSVSGAIVMLVADNGRSYSARTNTFGYYRIEGLASGKTYLGSVAARGVSFPSQSFTLESDLDGVNFVSSN